MFLGLFHRVRSLWRKALAHVGQTGRDGGNVASSGPVGCRAPVILGKRKNHVNRREPQSAGWHVLKNVLGCNKWAEPPKLISQEL